MQNLQIREEPYLSLQEVRRCMEYSIRILQEALDEKVSITFSPEERLTWEQESLYRALVNRYYYSVYEFFMWYSHKKGWVKNRDPIPQRGGRLPHVSHGTLPKIIKTNLTNPIRLRDPSGQVKEMSGKDIAAEIEALKGYRGDADY